MSPQFRSARMEHTVASVALVAGVAAISGLHYLASIHITGLHAVLLHETLKRLYYVPIVVAAMLYGAQGGLATSLLASALYLPHIVMSWSGWPVFEVDKYAEIVLFNVVGAVTGVIADRLRTERNRYRDISQELEIAYRQLEASTNQRIRAERLAAVGRVAADMAHEIRTPLGAILGCFEILAGDYPAGHPKLPFIDILKKEIARAEGVVATFLEFAQPPPPQRRRVDVNDIVRSAAQRFEARQTECRGALAQVELSPSPLPVLADADQVERCVVEILVTAAALTSRERPALSTTQAADGAAEIHVRVTGATQRLPEGLFETFDDRYGAHALMLPLIRRLLENQGGTITMAADDTHLDVTIALPRTSTAAVRAALPRLAAALEPRPWSIDDGEAQIATLRSEP